jgi:LDH2 family malate/lactate/ureidoglycolate dehydrogenase
MAIDIGHFRPEAEFRTAASAELARIRRSKSREGVLRTPGERSWTLRQASGGQMQVPAALAESLQRLADEIGLSDRSLR